jgi:hypothetical protein
MNRSLVVFTACAIALASAASNRAAADDYFLTIGGGYNPSGNQISLEKNVIFFQQLLAEQKPGCRHDIYFSDGDSPGRDLQFRDPSFIVPRANLLLARVFRKEQYFGLQYRSNELKNVQGASNKQNLEKWFDTVGAKLAAGDRLFIYVTAHGGRGSSSDKQNTGLYLWNSQKISMTEFVGYLDKVNPDVSVATVMVQCFSGGFANIAFSEGKADKGISGANRCGFFATVHDRPAAGCTPDIREEDYHEYSSYFWAGIGGKTRTGAAVAMPDYDGDGHVSLAEAHAYTLLESSTIDISITTSDAVLRKYSKLEAPKSEKGKDDKDATEAKGDGGNKDNVEVQPASATTDVAAEHWTTLDDPCDHLLALASPCQRAVIEGLSKQLGLSGEKRAAEARELAKKIIDKKNSTNKFRGRASRDYNKACDRIKETLLVGWPELYNTLNPNVAQLLSDQSTAIVEAIESHPQFKDFDRLHERLEKIDAEQLDRDRRWVKCQRLIRTLENVVYTANLHLVAPSDVQERYAKLVDAENQSLVGP